jgi:uncharacterized small protein (DUF1192 family)
VSALGRYRIIFRQLEGTSMAKALYGHLASTDHTMRWENERLRARITQLQAEVERLHLELAAASAPGLASVTDDLGLDGDSARGLHPALA